MRTASSQRRELPRVTGNGNASQLKVRSGPNKIDRDAAMGDLRGTDSGFQLVRDLEAPLSLRATDKMKVRLRNQLNLHCGRVVVYGHFVGAELEVESYESFGDMGYDY